jgi:hypothetical protein
MESAEKSEGRLGDAGEFYQHETDTSRREMLAKIGRFAYVAPALALLAQPKAVQAYGTRPGYGYGDSNHTHSGPPGLNK